MGAVAGPGLGNNYDYWNPQTQKVQIQAGPQSPAGYDYYGKPQPGPQTLGAAVAPSNSGGGGGRDVGALVQALMKGGYSGTDAQNAANNNYDALSREYLGAAQGQNDALLSSLNTEYDRNKESLNSQLGTLGTEKNNAMSALDLELQGVQNQVGTSRTNSMSNRDKAIDQAGDVARSTQSQNRNVLRSLGILNSTAGAELLSKPQGEFSKQRAGFVESFNQRSNELDNFLNEQVAQHAQGVKQIESQYADLVGKIQSDLRFNDRQRADAIKQANAALQSRMAEIQGSMMQFKQQVDLQKQQFAQGLAQQLAYQDPTFARSTFDSLLLSNPENQRQQIGITQSPEELRKKQGLLSAA